MKPVLIQSLINHNKKRKALKEYDIDHSHGGQKDRSGFMVLLILLVTIIIALALN